VALNPQLNVATSLPSNRRLQLTAFGARDRVHFDSYRDAPRRQLKRRTLDGNPSMPPSDELLFFRLAPVHERCLHLVLLSTTMP